MHRDGDQHDVREATVQVMLTGAFDKSFTGPDNSSVIATDSIKNIINITARENLSAGNEAFGIAIGKRFLDRYRQVERADIEVVEQQWQRLSFDGKPHGHSFTKVGNGNPVARIEATRNGVEIESGRERVHLHENHELGMGQLCDGRRHDAPGDQGPHLCHEHGRDLALRARTEGLQYRQLFDFAVDAPRVRHHIQRGRPRHMYRMGMAALGTAPEISQISMAMPNIHYLVINLSPFKLDNPNVVFVPTDAPHGQIECTVGRG